MVGNNVDDDEPAPKIQRFQSPSPEIQHGQGASLSPESNGQGASLSPELNGQGASLSPEPDDMEVRQPFAAVPEDCVEVVAEEPNIDHAPPPTAELLREERTRKLYSLLIDYVPAVVYAEIRNIVALSVNMPKTGAGESQQLHLLSYEAASDYLRSQAPGVSAFTSIKLRDFIPELVTWPVGSVNYMKHYNFDILPCKA